MNIVKKLAPSSPKHRPSGDVSGYETSSSAGGTGTPTSPASSSASQPSQDRMLSLMHLRKVFTDFCRSHSSSAEYEQKLYRMVPLFVKLTGTFTPDELQAQFKEAPQFASHLSKLFVQEVRRRATNQSTESAAAAIASYLEPENIGSGEFGGRGWQLLSSLTFLSESANNAPIVEAMCHAALSSTLVKSLYLFYDLPRPSSDPKSVERRRLLYDAVVELMFRLLSHTAAGEELARKEDLVLLFSGVSSWCPEHNRQWRRATAQLLMTLSSRILTPTVINYIHSKNCLGLFLNNLRQAKDLSVVDQAEMIVCIFCVLKDSAVLTSALTDDWKNINGYSYLTEFILNNENDTNQDAQDALRNLLLMFNSVVTAGHFELKPPPLSNTLFTLPGFSIPTPLGQGCSIRNMNAFDVLEQVFVRSKQSSICCTLLDVITSIYSADPANYFILEPRCTLGLFAEHIHDKDHAVQVKFFELFEYVVFHLNHVPCKELVAVTVLLKTQSNTECAVSCLHSLCKLLSHSQIFKDVFREVGILEVLTSFLYSLLEALRSHKDLTETQRNVYFLSLDILTLLLKQNNSNANVFRECNGSKSAQGLLSFDECRQGILILYQQLLATPGGDEELATLLALLHSSPLTDVGLKIQILKCIVYVLRESHRVRMAFRRIGGYLYTISLLVNMEGALSKPAANLWNQVDSGEVLNLLKLIFKALTLSMRFEPANAKFFSSEVRYSSLTDSLRLLGCFKGDKIRLSVEPVENSEFNDLNKTSWPGYQNAFMWAAESGVNPTSSLSSSESLICVVYRLLYDMALDNFDKPVFVSKKSDTSLDQLATTNNNAKVPCATDSMIVHPDSVLCMVELLPFIKEDNYTNTVSLQLYVSEIVKSLVRSERNQQVMCEAGLPRTIFSVASSLFISTTHPLLSPFYYILERLSTHAMQPKELREFLRLDRPLCCRDLDADDENDELSKEAPNNEGGPVPLSRVKTLVSMMTPRDFHLAGVNISPPFVEFDMSVEGFGCIFLPSVAPQGSGSSGNASSSGVGAVLTPASLVHSVAASSPIDSGAVAGASGGLGSGERVFPPLTGLTYSAWIYVEKYSEAGVDQHPIRLLTVTRSVAKGTGSGGGKFAVASGVDWPDFCELACLQIQISPADRALLLATHETDTPGADLDRDVVSAETYVRVSIPELRQEQQWLHLAVVFSRAVLKNSSASVYINGRHFGTYKIHYVIQNPGGGATTLAQAAAVNALIGTPPGPFRKQSKLLWRLGPCHLVEEAWSSNTVVQSFRLGPLYTGSFQSPVLPNGERLGSLVSEERITFGLHASAVSQMTLARLRKVYNKIDGKAIAKQLGISSHENATPIRILHNAAAHLNGPARSLGGVLIGYLGMRTFCPQPVPKLLESVGGMATILGLVAMAADTEGLYAAVKSLLCAVRTNRAIGNEMDRTRAYQTLAMLLKEKCHLLNGHVLHLLFALVGTLDSGRETTVIPNVQAFEDLLCDLLVWRKASPELMRLLYEHFYQLITECGDKGENLKIIRQVGLLGRILQTMAADPPLLWTTKEIAFNLVAAILQPPMDNASMLRFGQFIASTLPTSGPMEAEKQLPFDIRDLQVQLFSKGCCMDDPNQLLLYQVYLRNRCLNILLNILLHSSGNLNFQLCDQVSKVLGFDWILTLLNPRSHSGTVWTALRILLALTSHAPLLQRFKDGTGNGGWLVDAESVVQNRAGVLLGFSVSARGGAVGSACDLNPEICHIPGYIILQHLLPHHVRSPDPYLALLSLLVGQPAKDLPHVHEFDLDGIWSLIFGLPPNHSVADAISKVELCPEAAIPLLALVRRCVSLNSSDSWCCQYPLTLIQFLTFLYHNVAEFAAYMNSEEFVTSLASVVFRSPVLIVTGETSNGPKNKESGLPDHPVVKPVLDLLRNILVDSFAVVPANKSDSVVDLVLDFTPEGSTRQEQSAYATALLQLVTEHLIASDVLLCGQSSSLPLTLPINSNYSTLAANVFYFTSRLVDCLWSGLYIGNAQEVLDFILKLFAQTKRKSGGGVPTDSLYSSLNRTLLFMLSRFVDSAQAQSSVLECLQKITSSRSLVFSSANGDPEFFACLCHLLFMLTDVSGREIPLVVGDSERDPDVVREEIRIRDGAVLVANAARRVWEEMFLAKKQALEESFRMSLVPEINAARALLGETANRSWQNFVDSEMKGGGTRDAFQIHAQLQSKIQKMAGGLQRLASRKTVRPNSIARNVSVSYQTLDLWMFRVHIALIRELVELQYTQYQQWHEHTEKWCLDEWRSFEQELIRERGLWGPSRGSELDKWLLDSTEGPCRMRKKLVPNPMFYIHYPFRPNLELPENKSLKGKVAISRDSRLYYERVKARRGRMLDSRIIDTSSTVVSPPDDKPMLLRDMTEMNATIIRRASRIPPPPDQPTTQTSISGDDPEEPSIDANGEGNRVGDASEDTAIADALTCKEPGQENDSADKQMSGSVEQLDPTPTDVVVNVQSKTQPSAPAALPTRGPDNQTLLRLLEEGEELHSMFRCARINGLETSEGLLLFGKEHYYVVDGFTLLKTREIRDLDFLPEELHDPIVPYIASGPQKQRGGKRLCSKFPYEDIREVHKRRYLLQPIALEVFSADGRNYLLAFPKKVRNKVYGKFLSVAKSLTDTAHQSVSGQRSSVNLEQGVGLLGTLVGEASVTQRWVRGEISNFQYLMHLNTLAGRSYNDLSQYPVFPWVVADYESEELDLTNAASFRDFSMPMGAQTPERLEQFIKRYKEWDDPTGETPRYFYGTHYSSAMIVVSYLVRMEPFTQQFLKLQGGHFDLADRMFHSIKEGWLSASRNNMADVKELIPEFFYLPDFLTNSNRFDFGIKQNGVPLADIMLPSWAKGDPREFIRIHREALESDYVSAHLHEWIDLIFGSKQQGQSAIDAYNLFHHLFYEGNVDFESIEDPLTRNATIGFINNFGQIPTQLFKKPHPAKRVKQFAAGGPLSYSMGGSAVDPSLPTAGVTTERLFFHCLDALRPPMQPVKELKGGVGQIVHTDRASQVFAVEQNKVLAPPNYTKYFSWGFADGSIRLGVYDTDKSVCIHEHSQCGEIVCASCPNNRILVTGSTNTVVSVWEVVVASSRGGSLSLRLRKALYGHREPVSCVHASGNYGIIVSGSKDGSCIVWDLSKLSFIRQLAPHPGPVSAVCVNEVTGDIASSSGTHLFLWDINGQLLATVNTAASPKLDSKQLILCLTFSTLYEWDPQHVVITGSNDGIVRMWSLEYVQQPDEGTVPSSSSDGSGVPTAQESKGDQDKESVNRLSSSDQLHAFREEFTAEALRQRLVMENDEFAPPDTPRFSQAPSPSEFCSNGPDSGLGTPATARSASRDDENDVFLAAAAAAPPVTNQYDNAAPLAVARSSAARGDFRKQSSSDSFVFVNKDGLAVVKTPNRLKKGFHWQRQLVFRSKLTMHTAFERRDNPGPAAITALAPSKDHKTLFVGDARGRVWAWSVGDGSGGRADHWVQDPARSACAQCHQKFSLTERRHHCRNCGQIFCAKCSRFESEIRHLKISKPVRVCQNCYIRLKVMETGGGGTTP